MSLPRVLLVDDEPSVLSALRRALRGIPCDLVLETDPQRALSCLRAETVAVVASDQHMPTMSGTELLTRARWEAPFAERLLLSGRLDAATAQAAVNSAGVSQLLEKPWNSNEFRAAISAAIGRHGIRVAMSEFPAVMERLLASKSAAELVRAGIQHFLPEPDPQRPIPSEVVAEFQESGSLARSGLPELPPELRERASKDSLTGLYNRRHLEAVLEGLTRPGGGALSLVMVDVDHFKQINDSFGHQQGDEVLRRVARTLSSSSRSSDVVCRYGGDEFTVVLPQTPLAGAAIYAERVQAQFAIAGPCPVATLSIGFAEHLAGDPPERLLLAADRALYRSKRSGRNRTSAATGLEQVREASK